MHPFAFRSTRAAVLAASLAACGSQPDPATPPSDSATNPPGADQDGADADVGSGSGSGGGARPDGPDAGASPKPPAPWSLLSSYPLTTSREEPGAPRGVNFAWKPRSSPLLSEAACGYARLRVGPELRPAMPLRATYALDLMGRRESALYAIPPGFAAGFTSDCSRIIAGPQLRALALEGQTPVSVPLRASGYVLLEEPTEWVGVHATSPPPTLIIGATERSTLADRVVVDLSQSELAASGSCGFRVSSLERVIGGGFVASAARVTPTSSCPGGRNLAVFHISSSGATRLLGYVEPIAQRSGSVPTSVAPDGRHVVTWNMEESRRPGDAAARGIFLDVHDLATGASARLRAFEFAAEQPACTRQDSSMRAERPMIAQVSDDGPLWISVQAPACAETTTPRETRLFRFDTNTRNFTRVHASTNAGIALVRSADRAHMVMLALNVRQGATALVADVFSPDGTKLRTSEPVPFVGGMSGDAILVATSPDDPDLLLLRDENPPNESLHKLRISTATITPYFGEALPRVEQFKVDARRGHIVSVERSLDDTRFEIVERTLVGDVRRRVLEASREAFGGTTPRLLGIGLDPDDLLLEYPLPEENAGRLVRVRAGAPPVTVVDYGLEARTD